MMDAYTNTSCVPRTHIQKVLHPIGRQIVFNLRYAGALRPDKRRCRTRDEIDGLLTAFIASHAAALAAVERPRGFMIGMMTRALDSLKKDFPDTYRLCDDPLLTVAILGRMAGTLYVPRREIRFEGNFLGYDSSVAFPEKYFSA